MQIYLKKAWFLPLFLCITACFEGPHPSRSSAPNAQYGYLLNADHSPAEELTEVFKTLNAPVGDALVLNGYAQKNFLRQGERQEQQAKAVLYQPYQEALEPLFAKLGLTQAFQPTHTQYDAIILLGSFVQTMQQKVAYLNDLFEKNPNLSAKNVYFLVGDRRLEDKETPAVLALLPKDEPLCIKMEADIAEYVWAKEATNSRLKAMNLKVVRTEAKQDPRTQKYTIRPNTADTIVTWHNQEKPPLGRFLVVAINPFIGYQAATFRTVMAAHFGLEPSAIAADLTAAKGWSFECIGPFIEYQKIDPSIGQARAFIMLDTIARWLYTEVQALKKS